MCRLMLRLAAAGLLCAVGWLGGPGHSTFALAQPPATTPPDAGAPAPDADRPWREQTIYVPYTRLREMFEKQGRGVFLPYEKFQELWQAAKAARPAPADLRPPVGALIAEIDSTATVDRDVLKVTAKLQIELLAPGWHRVPLRMGDCALLSARFGDQPALVLYDNQGYYLLVRATPQAVTPAAGPAPPVVVAAKPDAPPAPDAAKPDAPQPADAPKPDSAPPGVAPPVPAPPVAVPPPPAFKPERRELTIEYAKAYTKSPGQNSVSLEAPQAPVNRWQVRVPQAGAKITLQPLIAVNELPARDSAAKPNEKPVEETALQAFVGAAPTVRIDWTAKSEGAAGLTALVNVQSRQQVQIDEGVMRTNAQLTYEISRADITQVRIEVPPDQTVIGVFDANIRPDWEVKKEGNVHTIVAQLYQPTRGTQKVVIELEKFLTEMPARDLSVPAVKALDVGRQQGIALVRLAPELRGELVRRVGLTQLDAGELPAAERKTPWDFTFRYPTLPFDLALSLEKVQPRVQVDELVEAYLETDRLYVSLLALFQIEKAGVFQFEFNVPEGYDLRNVRGQAAAGAEAVAVDSFRREGEKQERLIVSLSRKAIGKVGLVVELEKRLDDPNLVQPTGQATKYDIPLPRVTGQGIERENGRLVMFAPESLRVVEDVAEGLRTISATEAAQGVESQRAGRFPETRELLAYAFGKTPARLGISVDRRKPAVTVRQLLVARVEAGAVKYEATFFYDVRFSGVKALRIDVPQELAATLRNESRYNNSKLNEKTLENADPPPAEGYVAWSFSGETELIGQPQIKLTWTHSLGDLPLDSSRDVSIPHLQPRGGEIERAWGQIVVTKAESLDIRPASVPKGLRPIDPQHDLMAGAAVADAAGAFEFQADWTLVIAVRRYKLEEVKRTLVELGLIRMVATRGGKTAVQAIYRVRSTKQRLGLKLPAEFKLDTQPLRIDGQSQDLERGEGDTLFVPLVGRKAGEPVAIELRYTLDRGPRRLDLPEFLDDPAVQQIYLAAYLPIEWVVLGSLGPWTEEFRWNWDAARALTPIGMPEDGEILGRLTKGISLTTPVGDSFPLDGTRYVFSTLRPEAAPQGSLSIVSMRRLSLSGLTVVLLIALGIVGWRRSFGYRLMLMSGVIVGLVVLGVFLPTFVQQMLDGTFIVLAVAVLVVWLVEMAVRGLKALRADAAARRAAVLAAASAAAAAAAVSPPPPPPGPDSAASASAAPDSADVAKSDGKDQPRPDAAVPSDAGRSPFKSDSNDTTGGSDNV